MRPKLRVTHRRFVYMPMRDGIHLAVDLILPRRAGRYPAVLIRTPYGKGGFADQAALAERGYAVAIADARGTGASEGVYSYYNMVDGLYDGYDLVEWLAAQPFCDGNVGTVGGSAMGIYQILTGWSRPPHLRCQCISAYPLDFYTDQWYPGGVFRLSNRMGWIEGLRHRCSPGAALQQAFDDPEADEDADAAAARRRAIFLKRMRRKEEAWRRGDDPDAWARPYLQAAARSPEWDGIDLTPLLRKIDVPVLHSAVYYDHFGIGSVRGYQVHDGPKALMLVPGGHGMQGEEGDFGRELEWQWLGFYLKDEGRAEEVTRQNVRLWTTGAEAWSVHDQLPAGEKRTFFATAEGRLANEPGEGSLSLTCDPTAPFGSDETRRMSDYEARPDVLTFTTPPLPSPLHVFGRPLVHCRLRTSLPDANLIAWICAVGEEGASRPLNFGAQKLSLRDSLAAPTPVPSGEAIDAAVECWTVSHRFHAGTRLRVTLALQDFPFFENAPHAGEVMLDLAGCRLEMPVVS